MANLLEARDVTVSYTSADGAHKALDGVSFSLGKGESVGLVGESGSGKTTLGLSILRLLPQNAVYGAGSILYDGKDLLSMDEKSISRVRGKDISIVFQDPLASLDPLFTVGYQIAETVKAHRPGIGKAELATTVIAIMEAAGLAGAEGLQHRYPHELSGGMRQRIMIAIALVNNPVLLIADEPTTALDVTIQAQIIDLLKRAKQQYNLTILLITHDLGVAYELVDRFIIMYGGVIVEQGPREEIFSKPYHPYTKALLMAIPELMDIAVNNPHRLSAIPGAVRPHYDNYRGCRFYDRCSYRTPECLDKDPDLTEYSPGHPARCIHPLL